MIENIFEVDLTSYQVEQIEEKLPAGYQFQLSFSKREKRKVQGQIKKVVKFDANFKEANERKWSPAIKKLFGVFQKLKSHPKFVEFEEILQDEYLLDRVEQGFTTTTYTEAKFYEDVCAVFKASYQVNARNSPGYLTTTILETFFKDCFRAHRQSQQQSLQQSQQQQTTIKQKVKEARRPVVAATPQPMSYQEKKQLGESIRKLPTEDLRGVWEIVQEGLNVQAEDGEELEFDLDKLPPEICRRLERYVTARVKRQDQPKKNKKVKSAREESDILDVDQP